MTRTQQSRKTPKKTSGSRLLGSAEAVIARNDARQIWTGRGMKVLLILIPVLLVVIVPAVFLVAISIIGVEARESFPEAILSILPPEAEGMTYRQQMQYAFTRLLCPMLFLAVPIITAIGASCYSFISERDSGVLETLFLSSVSPRNIFNAKVIASTMMSVVISLICFAVFTVVMGLGSIFISASFFFDPMWLVILFLLMPALSMLCALFISMLAPRMESMKEGLQTIGYFLLPIVIISLMQFNGLFYVDFLPIFTFTLLLIIADIVLFNVAGRRFSAERTLTGAFMKKRKAKLNQY